MKPNKQLMSGSLATGLLTRKMTTTRVKKKTKIMTTTMRKTEMTRKAKQLTLLLKFSRRNLSRD